MSSFDREVAVPDLGEDAYMIFGLDEMDRFELEYGEEYVTKLIASIDRSTISVMRKALDVMLKDSKLSPDEILSRFPMQKVGAWLVDAIALSLHGRRMTAAED